MGSAATIQLPPLTKQSMNDLFTKAKRLGIGPGDYAKRLIEEGLAFQREAEECSFAQIMTPVRQVTGTVSDAEIVKLVAMARPGQRNARRRKKR
jgi:hypothetical protein